MQYVRASVPVPIVAIALLIGACNSENQQAQPPAPKAEASSPSVKVVGKTEMKRFVDYLNEVSERRRRVVYTSNPQSTYDGLSVGLVNSHAGNLTLSRRDIVVPGRIPIVFSRVYDSRLGQGSDFGFGGWRLGLAERIEEIDDRNAVMHSSGAARLNLVRVGDTYKLARAESGDVREIVRSGNRIEVRTNQGLVKSFAGTKGLFLLASVADAFGNRIDFTYQKHALVEVKSDSGRAVKIERDDGNRVTRVSDQGGRSVSYIYDGTGRLMRVMDLNGNGWHYEYDSAGRLTTALAPGGQVDVSAIYAGDGKVSDIYAHGLRTAFKYDAEVPQRVGLTGTRVFAEQRRETLIGHDESGRAVYARNHVGTVTEVILNDAGLPSDLRRNGAKTKSFSYDDHGRLLATSTSSKSLQDERHFSYNNQGELANVSDGNGVTVWRIERRPDGFVKVAGNSETWSYANDANGSLSYFKWQDQPGLILRSDDNGQVVSVLDEYLHRQVSLGYHESGTLAFVELPDGARREFQYDGLGMRTNATGAGRPTENYFYSAAGSLYRHEIVNDAGEAFSTNYQLDDANRLIRRIDKLQTWEHHYDGNDELVMTRRVNDGFELYFGYDSLDRLVSVSDKTTETYVYEYEDGETDLRVQLDNATRMAESPSNDTVFGTSLRLMLNRAHGARYELARFDERLGEFQLVGREGMILPGEFVESTVRRMRLLHAIETSVPSQGSPEAQLAKFSSPSNVLFVPTEFWTVNCGSPPPCSYPIMGFGDSYGLAAACPGDPDPPPPGGGTGGSWSQTTATKMDDMLDRIRDVGRFWSAIQLTLAAGNLSTGVLNNTIQWALNDIDRFRQIGLHVTNPTGSIIPWQQIEVDWSKYGSNDASLSDEQVLNNFMNAAGAVGGGGGGGGGGDPGPGDCRATACP